MAAIDDVKSAWETEIAKISDTLLNAEATYILDQYIDARTAQASLSSDGIQSYTIAERTVTRRNADMGQALINDLQNQLTELVYGKITLADANYGVATP
jgi:hypothetical protein